MIETLSSDPVAKDWHYVPGGEGTNTSGLNEFDVALIAEREG